jgi:DDE superfamily endonuclease
VKQNAIGGSRPAATPTERSHPKNPSVHAPTEALAWWLVLLELFQPIFTAPTFAAFEELLTAWVLCPARRTVTGMMRGGDLVHRRPHDAYHRLIRAAAWSLDELWDLTAELLVGLFAEEGRIDLLLDDTLFHRRGRKINGAGIFRDAVRSSGGSVVYDRGLNLVVLALRVKAPWGGEPLALPLAVRLHRKGGRTMLDLSAESIHRLAEHFPNRTFHLIADGAYGPLAGWGLPRTAVTSRIRRDAALYGFPPLPRKGQVGRPPKKGARLAPLPRWANHTRNGWTRAIVDRRGRLEERLLLAREVLWYHVCGAEPIRVVVSRDPKGHEKDDFFFTTDLTMNPGEIISHYHGRWPIEDTLRAAKQSLGGEEPQTWKGRGPERAASLAFWLYSMVWTWYLASHGPKPKLVKLPWYPKKVRPSFIDAVSALRGELWRERVSSNSEGERRVREITRPLIEALELSR